MLVHREIRTVFLSHPRTASLATERALERVGFEWVENSERRHMRLEQWPWWAEQPEEERERWTVLTTVRNHFDALVSWSFLKKFDLPRLSVRYVTALVDSTREYLPDPHRLWAYHARSANRLLRYESLGSDLNQALADCGVAPTEIPRENVSEERGARPYQDFYDRETRRFVEGLFREEMKQLDYTWKE